MRRLLALIAVAVTLGGCAEFQMLGKAVSLSTATVANPITPAREAQIEAGFDVAVQLLLVYRRACIKGNADANCRHNIELIQPYTRMAQNVLIPQLRKFVKANDQVNAVSVFNQLLELYGQMKATAGTVGVNLGSLAS